eukprot:9000041-Alexandrium_andersonii.AAC.1
MSEVRSRLSESRSGARSSTRKCSEASAEAKESKALPEVRMDSYRSCCSRRRPGRRSGARSRPEW